MDQPIKPYQTVSTPAEVEVVEKRSRFIGRCRHVTTEQEALTLLEQIRKQCWDATHNCYAYLLRSGAARYSDDGEPSGTAGMPMMECLKRMDVTDTVVVVTRYFGGILLGAGGLVRAYSKSACDAVRAAKPVWMLPCTAYSVRCPYPYWNTVKLVCEQYGRIETTTFTDMVESVVWVQQVQESVFGHALTERTEGRIVPTALRADYFPFPTTED